MATELGVNENHHAQVINYMRFARYQRGQRLRAVDICFDEVKDSRLSEDTTFTVDEVSDMMDGLLTVVRGEVESELINTAHTNVLLMRQMFRQAEKWHLKLQADISELENRELLEKIKDFEEKQFAGTKRDTDISALKNPKLTPLNEGGGAALLHMKIDELNMENEQMRAKLLQVQNSLSSAERRRLQLEGDLFSATRSNMETVGHGEDVDELKRKMSGLETQLDRNKKMSAMNAGQLEGDLVNTKHELLRIQEMLEMAEKELEKKLHQTAPFKNLKQMLQQKNERLKEYRKRLSKYESVTDD